MSSHSRETNERRWFGGWLRRHPIACIALLAFFIGACVTQGPGSGAVHRWWAGRGPVLPHESFPADCTLCHVGVKWDTLRSDFEFDHEKKTGVALHGAHARAQCLRCHNDRGRVAVFQSKGCAGCHEDTHNGRLGQDCKSCHQENTWSPVGQIERHNSTRLPLAGAHLAVSCNRCHPGAFVGNFSPTPVECHACHADDAAATTNPPHIGLGWIRDCERCHMPTRWRQATLK